MTREDFEKTDDYKLMQFIGANYQKMVAKFTNEGKDFVCTHDKLEIEPIKWFQLLIFYFGFKAESIKGESDKIAFLAQARSNCLQLVYSLERMLAEVSWTKRYDLRGFIDQVDALIGMGKTELEAQLLVSQIATNDNTQTTNKANKILLTLTTIFAILATIVTAGSFTLSVLDSKREGRKEQREVRANKLDSTLQAVRSEIAQLKNSNALYLNQISHLQRVVDSLSR